MTVKDTTKGLWRLVGSRWVQFERVYVTSKGDGNDIVHAARVGQDYRTACGNRIGFRLGTHATDTISQIECKRCASILELTTK